MRERARVRGVVIATFERFKVLMPFPLIRPSATFSLMEKG